jgi:hypothetical protein
MPGSGDILYSIPADIINSLLQLPLIIFRGWIKCSAQSQAESREAEAAE